MTKDVNMTWTEPQKKKHEFLHRKLPGDCKMLHTRNLLHAALQQSFLSKKTKICDYIWKMTKNYLHQWEVGTCVQNLPERQGH